MPFHMLCIDDDAQFLFSIQSILKTKYKVSTAQNFKEAKKILLSSDIDLVFLDLELKDIDGLMALELIKKEFPSVEVFMLSGHKDPKQIVESVRKGAIDYISKDSYSDEIFAYIDKALHNRDLKDRYAALIQNYNPAPIEKEFIGGAESFQSVLDQARRLRGFNANVLIEGDSGTGKELLARYIHNIENDPKRPFIAVNCATIPEGLAESELFGHEKGAFSGASERRAGKFELADGGDIFLDEINSLKVEVQAKFLRALQEKEFYRVGGIKSISVNFRVIATSNINLASLVEKGKFREDLYHRLKVLSLVMPALKKRKEDIPLLANHFVSKFPQDKQKRFTERALKMLAEYEWPGNIRELQNIVQSLVILSPSKIIDVCDLPKQIYQNQSSLSESKITRISLGNNKYFDDFALEPDLPLSAFRKETESRYIKWVLDLQEGNKAATARVLGVSRVTLHSMLKSKILN